MWHALHPKSGDILQQLVDIQCSVGWPSHATWAVGLLLHRKASNYTIRVVGIAPRAES